MQKNIKNKIVNFHLLTYIFAILLLLPSCATKEFRQAEQECSVVSFQYYPPNYQRMLVTRTYWEYIPVGYHCHHRHCHMQTMPVLQYYQVWEDVDVNTEARDSYIVYCTEEVCKQRYGNAKCEVKEQIKKEITQ